MNQINQMHFVFYYIHSANEMQVGKIVTCMLSLYIPHPLHNFVPKTDKDRYGVQTKSTCFYLIITSGKIFDSLEPYTMNRQKNRSDCSTKQTKLYSRVATRVSRFYRSFFFIFLCSFLLQFLVNTEISLQFPDN
jgi:hypothetical protein